MPKKCYLIGAGASYGYDESIPVEERPPKGIDLLSKALKNGFLTEDKYPDFLDVLQQYAINMKKDSKNYTDIDIEEFLEDVALAFDIVSSLTKKDLVTVGEEEIDTLLEPLRFMFRKLFEEPQLPSEQKLPTDPNHLRAIKLQRVLGEASFLIWEQFRAYSFRYRASFDNYQRLALYHLNEPYNIVSLNYDTIFELAAMQSGLNIQYSGTPKMYPFGIGPSRIINIAKVHGSINWFNLYSRGIALGGIDKGYSLLHRISNVFHTNHVDMEPPIIVNPPALAQFDINDMLMSGNQYYEPIIVPPIGKYKDYEKVKFFNTNWEDAGNMISSANELIIIGISLREQDNRLRNLLAVKVKDGVKVTIVGSKGCFTRISEILGSKLKSEPNFFDNFSSYARSL